MGALVVVRAIHARSDERRSRPTVVFSRTRSEGSEATEPSGSLQPLVRPRVLLHFYPFAPACRRMR